MESDIDPNNYVPNPYLMHFIHPGIMNAIPRVHQFIIISSRRQQSPPTEERNETIHSDKTETDWWARIAELIAAIATVALAVIGYFGVHAANDALDEIKQQTEITKASVDVAKASSKAAELNAQAIIGSERPVACGSIGRRIPRD